MPTLYQSKEGDSSSRRHTQSRFPWAVLAIWALCSSIPLTYLTAGHFASLPIAPHAILEADRSQTANEKWRITHVLSDQCRCSLDVIEYLSERKALPSALEQVILIDSEADTAERLRRRGFAVRQTDGESFCQINQSEGVPFLQITDPDDRMWYSGAYRGFKYNSAYLDIDLLASAKSRIVPKAYPVTGCATSQRLKDILDPLRLKYD